MSFSGSENRGSVRGLSPPGSAELSEGDPGAPGHSPQPLRVWGPTAAGGSRGLEEEFWR